MNIQQDALISAKTAEIRQIASSVLRLAHRTPHGTRPLGTKINIVYLAFLKTEYFTILEEKTTALNSRHKNLTLHYIWVIINYC